MATDTRTFGTGASDSGSSGGTPITSPSNILASDTTYATASLTANNNTYYAKATNSSHSSGTALGSGDTITQIAYKVTRKKSGNPGANIRDWKVYPVEGGSVVTTTNFADTASDWGTSDTTITYTQTTNLPTAATVLASDWGWVLAFQNTNGVGSGQGNIDYMEAVITFTPGPTDPAFDTATTGIYTVAPSFTVGPITVSSNSNRYLLLGVASGSSGDVQTVVSATFGGVAMSFVGAKTAANNHRIELWELIAPASGSGSATITMSAISSATGVLCAFYNVQQTNPTEGFASATATAGTSATIDVATVPDKCLVVDLVASTDTSLTVGSGQTQRGAQATSFFTGMSSEQKTPAGTVTMDWTGVTGGETWTILAVALRPTTAPNFGTAALTGTVFTSSVLREPDVVAGGKTIIITLTGDTWVASGATFNAQRQNLIDMLDSQQAEAHGWDVEVKAKEVVGAVVRTSDTVCTITLTAEAAYDITANETIGTLVIPATALTNGYTITPSPSTFRVVPTYNVIGHLGGLRVNQDTNERPLIGTVRAGIVPAGMRRR